jgi:hypothetical protein
VQPSVRLDRVGSEFSAYLHICGYSRPGVGVQDGHREGMPTRPEPDALMSGLMWPQQCADHMKPFHLRSSSGVRQPQSPVPRLGTRV